MPSTIYHHPDPTHRHTYSPASPYHVCKQMVEQLPCRANTILGATQYAYNVLFSNAHKICIVFSLNRQKFAGITNYTQLTNAQPIKSSQRSTKLASTCHICSTSPI